MKNKKIAIFFGGKITHHLRLLRMAARKLRVQLDLVSYNRVCFEAGKGVYIRGDKARMNETWEVSEYDVLFFRTTGKHWEEVSLILDAVKGKDITVVDPLVKNGRPSDACKAYQMLELAKAGIGVPKTIYGSLWYLYEMMKNKTQFSDQHFFSSGECGATFNVVKKTLMTKADLDQKNLLASDFALDFNFPIILKGSGGDRGSRVFKIDNLEEMEKMVRALRKSETVEGKRYMVQKFIPNSGDYRLLILGEKVLGVMKRSSQSIEEFRNNYSVGGKVEVADLPESIKKMAVKAAKVCGLMVAGVDVMEKPKSNSLKVLKSESLKVKSRSFEDGEMSGDSNDYVVLEVNKGPQFRGFMEATGIDVPKEIIKFLISL
ncbi:MAG: hypothetical protein WC841_04105 [Candidatus Shapirobacteria bacterium]|jgi:ribosomal protein S6--L-glutamate ligase